MAAVTELAALLPAPVLALLRSDVSSPSTCAEAVAAALEEHPRFRELVAALTGKDGPCACDDQGASPTRPKAHPGR